MRSREPRTRNGSKPPPPFSVLRSRFSVPHFFLDRRARQDTHRRPPSPGRANGGLRRTAGRMKGTALGSGKAPHRFRALEAEAPTGTPKSAGPRRADGRLADQAGLLAYGSTAWATFPPASLRRTQWRFAPAWPITAAAPRRLRTVFPILPRRRSPAAGT